MSNFKETSEVLALIETTGRAVGKKVVAGSFGFMETLELFKNEEFQENLTKAIEKIKLVPSELKDLSIFDSIMLGKRVLEVVGVLADSFQAE